MIDLFDYAQKNNVTITICSTTPDAFFVRIQNGAFHSSGLVTPDTAAARLDEMVADIGRQKARGYGAEHVARQLRDRERFFKEQ